MDRTTNGGDHEGGERDLSGDGVGTVVRRGRVVVKEIGARTKKGGYHMTLSRCKNYAVFRRKLSTFITWLISR